MFLDLDEYNKDVNSDIKNPISFNSPESFFSCNPGKCTFDVQSTELASNESYSFCGGQALEDTSFSCSISNSENVVTKILESGASAISGDMENVEEVRGGGAATRRFLHFITSQLLVRFRSLQCFYSSNRQMSLRPPSMEVFFLTTNRTALRNLALFMPTSYRKLAPIIAKDILATPSANSTARVSVTLWLTTSQLCTLRYVPH